MTDPTLPDLDRLSEEHVPPKSELGGKAMLLTCRRCNNLAGRNLDWHAQRAERVHQLKYGGLKRPVRARMTLPGMTWVATDFMMTDEGGHFVVKDRGAPKENPALLKSGFENWIRSAIQNEMEVKVEFDDLTHDQKHADASWLRSAYLATFSQFGYGMVGDHVYQVIREQIRDPKADLGLAPYVFPSPVPDRWGLIVVKQEHDSPGVLVMMGRRFVQLPFAGDAEFWPRMHRVAKREGSVTFTGTLRPWPREPVLEIDEYNLARHAAQLDTDAGNTV